MTGCEDPDCKRTMERRLAVHDKTLYGNDGTTGLNSSVHEKVDKSSMSRFVLFFVGAIITLSISFAGVWGNAANERKENKSQIAVIQSQLEAIKEDINEIKASQKKMSEKQIDPDKFLRDLKKIIEDK